MKQFSAEDGTQNVKNNNKNNDKNNEKDYNT